MRRYEYSLAAFLIVASLSGWLLGQQVTTPSAAVVPQLVNFSGKAIDPKGNVVSGITGITFSIYKDQYEGAPLWMETQNVTADAKGNYTVQLGVTSDGLPLELFSTGEARWLGVQINGGEEQPRVLLLSVPYALKAADAQTLGGLPASAFALALQPNNGSSSSAAHTSANVKSAVTSSVSGTGKTDYIPLWTNSTGGLGDSVLYQSGTKIGVNTTTPATALDVKGKVNASGGFDLAGKSFGFGSYTSGNAFMGFAGNTTTVGIDNTATGLQALSSLTSGGTNTAQGAYALQSNSTGGSNTAVGANALSFNSSGSDNTAMGQGALFHNTTGTENTAIGSGAVFGNQGSNDTGIGYQALYSNSGGSGNTAIGWTALYRNSTGYLNVAVGAEAAYANTQGVDNVAVGTTALFGNTTGSENTAVGTGALESATGDGNTCIGYDCTATAAVSNSTAIGAHAVVEQSNSLVLGGTGIHAVKVGIGTTTPSAILTVARGAGHPVSDSWETYSSRRWKTNIKTLPDALAKVERLRGVSYDLKDSGKREIGVIAEEVGKVVPEIVSYESNSKDASGVDYGRLTALLIEAVKQQQQEISALRVQLRKRAAREAMLESRLGRLERERSPTQLSSARQVQ
jgi:trimeric autotransporter adhesin